MRLIDADALKERIRKFLGIKSLDYLLPAEKSIVWLIDQMPTIEQRKTGKWIVRNGEDWKGRPTGEKICKCDQCGEKEILSFGRQSFDFCPKCGADMRGEEKS